MPIGTDIRQAIILALESQGADVITTLANQVRDLKIQQEMYNKQIGDSVITHDRYVNGLVKTETEIEKSNQLLISAIDLQNGFTAELQDTLIPLESLIVKGLKWQDELRKIGTDAEQAAAGMKALQAALGAMNDKSHESKADNAREQQLNDELVLLNHLQRLTEESAAAEVQAANVTAQARQRGTQAVLDEIAAINQSREAEGARMRARIEAFARSEQWSEEQTQRAQKFIDQIMATTIAEDKRAKAIEDAASKIIAANQAEMDAAERSAQKEVATAERKAKAVADFVASANADLQRKDDEEAKLDAQAKARLDAKAARDKKTLDDAVAAAERAAKAIEEADEKAAQAAIQAQGDAQRTRIDAYARAERQAEQLAQAEIQAAGDAKRARIDAYARAEQAAEQAAQVAIQKAGEEKRARIDAYADIDAAREQSTRRQTRDANADAWVGQHKGNLDSLIADMHAYEQASDAMTATELRNYTQIVSASSRAAQAQDRTTRASQGASRAFLEVSRGVEDFATGGFIGALNNIPGTIEGIGSAANISSGALAGLTATVSVLATAAYVLYNNWDKIENYFEMGIPRPILDTTDELKRKLDAATKITTELGKETRLSLSELNQYEKATQDVKDLNKELDRRRELEQLLSGQSKAERERGSAFKEALEETQGGAKMAQGQLESAIAQHTDAKGLVLDETTGKMVKPSELANRLILDASKGDARSIEQIQNTLDSTYIRREGDFASRIDELSPATKAREKKAEEVRKAEDEARKEASRIDREQKREREQKDREVQQAEQDALNEANKIGREQAKESEKEIADNAKRFQPGVQDALTQTALGHLASGASVDQSFNRLAPQLTDRLKGSGVPDRIARQVAESILLTVFDKLSGKVEAGNLAGQGNAQQVASRLFANRSAQASQQELAQIRLMANQEQMAGQIGQASIIMQQFQIMHANLQRQLAQNNDRFGRQRRQPRRPTIGR